MFGSEGKYLRQFSAASPQLAPEPAVTGELAPEQNRRFLTLVLTRASARDVRKRFRKLRGDLEPPLESLGSAAKRHQFPQSAFINELSAALEPTDLVLSSQLVRELEAFAALIHSCWPNRDLPAAPGRLPGSPPGPQRPWLVVSHCPLLYLDLKSIRLFLTTDAAALQEGEAESGADDTLLVTLHALTVVPYSENPLERVQGDPELFAQVRYTSIPHY